MQESQSKQVLITDIVVGLVAAAAEHKITQKVLLNPKSSAAELSHAAHF
jgi:hypothetical protein